MRKHILSSVTSFIGFGFSLVVANPLLLHAVPAVTLTPSVASPRPLGTPVVWTATATDTDAGTLWYQFSVASGSSPHKLVIDYGPAHVFNWTPNEHEGTYSIQVSVGNLTTHKVTTIFEPFTATSLVTGTTPVVTGTPNPLIALYSAPPCASGGNIRVRFFRTSGGYYQNTPLKPCVSGQTMNFYIAGMLAKTQYTMLSDVFSSGGVTTSAPVTFTTGTPTISATNYIVGGSAAVAFNAGPVLLQSPINLQGGAYPLATDLYGNLLWYYPNKVGSLTRAEPGGNMMLLVETGSDFAHQLLRKIDIAGNTLLETNVARINGMLVSYGKTITGFSHEARLLPNGNIITIGYTERILANVQGSGSVDVLGDIILVLNPNLQVIWAWDTFDHLDQTRMAVLGEVCKNPFTPGCPKVQLASQANDWVHGNSLQVAPDGSIIYSARHQDMVYKIDYGNGAGTGNVLWKLGKDGDFTFLNTTDPYPWFSHQHDANFNKGGTQLLTLFDDGDTRILEPGAGTTSRGQALNVNQATKTVTFALNADLLQYTAAAGSAQLLPNGHYHFDSAFLANQQSQAVEVDASGKVVYALQSNYPTYRSFRLPDLYSAVY